MNDLQTDADWEWYGRNEPYFGVLTSEQFRRESLNDEARRLFFESGEAHVDSLFTTIRTHIAPDFSPKRCLDFGCGVGRLTLPLARRSDAVVGLDVSQGMLAEATANGQAASLANVQFLRIDDELTGVEGPFDLVNTYIVLQHIPCVRGLPIIGKLIALLAEGGVGAIHLTYSNAWIPKDPGCDVLEWPPRERRGIVPHLRALAKEGKRWIRGRSGGTARSESSLSTPSMQMNAYALNPVFATLQAANVGCLFAKFTDHGGYHGLMLYFRKATSSR